MPFAGSLTPEQVAAAVRSDRDRRTAIAADAIKAVFQRHAIWRETPQGRALIAANRRRDAEQDAAYLASLDGLTIRFTERAPCGGYREAA